MILRQVEGWGELPHLVRCKHSLLKYLSIIFACSYKVRLYSNHFRSNPSLLLAMTSSTAPVRLGIYFTLLPYRKITILTSHFQ